MLDSILLIVAQFATLLGVAALIAAIVNLLKVIGIVKDGTSMYWSSGLSLAAFIALVVLKIFRPDLSLEFLDKTALGIATVLLFVLGFITQIVSAPMFHKALSGGSVPVIGKSFSPAVTQVALVTAPVAEPVKNSTPPAA